MSLGMADVYLGHLDYGSLFLSKLKGLQIWWIPAPPSANRDLCLPDVGETLQACAWSLHSPDYSRKSSTTSTLLTPHISRYYQSGFWAL